MHNRLVGASLSGSSGNFEKTLNGLRNAVRAGIDVSVNTPLCTDNSDYEKTLRFLHGEGIRYVSCSGLIQTGKASSAHSVANQISDDGMKDILSRAVVCCATNGMELSFTSPGWLSP